MAKTMTASNITDGQIDNVVAKLRDAIRKNRSDFELNSVQTVLGLDNLGMRLLEPFRVLVDANSNTITRRIRVNRTRTPQEALDAIGRVQYTNKGVVSTMPRGDGDEVEMVFFNLGRYISDDDLEKELELRGLVSDPYAQMAVNDADPAFADTHPNGTHWKDAEGKWCFATFDRWDGGERCVVVRRNFSDWYGIWWFGGRRK